MSDDKLKTLTAIEATVMYWKCKGLTYKQIGYVKVDFGEVRVTQVMADVYDNLGIPRKLNPNKKKELLKPYCDQLDTLIRGNPINLKKFPLTTEGITEEPPLKEATSVTVGPLEETKEEPSTEKESPPPSPPTNEEPPIEKIDGLVDDDGDREQPEPPLPPPPTHDNDHVRLPWWIPALAVLFCVLCIISLVIALLLRQRFFHDLPVLFPTATITPYIPLSRTPRFVPAVPSVTSTDTPIPTVIPTDTLTETPTETLVPLVVPPNGILFEDNFDNGISNGWTRFGDDWITSDGNATLDHSAYDKNIYEWLILDHPEWKNYAISLDVQNSAHGYSPFGSVIIAVRVGQESNNIGVYLDELNLIYWATIGSNEPIAISGRNETLRFATGSNVGITVKGDNYSLMINGQNLQTISTTKYDSGGIKIGIYCHYYLQCPSIDNVKVTYLP